MHKGPAAGPGRLLASIGSRCTANDEELQAVKSCKLVWPVVTFQVQPTGSAVLPVAMVQLCRHESLLCLLHAPGAMQPLPLLPHQSAGIPAGGNTLSSGNAVAELWLTPAAEVPCPAESRHDGTFLCCLAK